MYGGYYRNNGCACCAPPPDPPGIRVSQSSCCCGGFQQGLPAALQGKVSPEEYESALGAAASTARKLSCIGVGVLALCILISIVVGAILNPMYVAPRYICKEEGGMCGGAGGAGCCSFWCCDGTSWLPQGAEDSAYTLAGCTVGYNLEGQTCQCREEQSRDLRGRVRYTEVCGTVYMSGDSYYDEGKVWPRDTANTVGLLLFVAGLTALCAIVCGTLPRKVESHFHSWSQRGVRVVYRGARCGRCASYLILSTPEHHAGVMLGPAMHPPLAPGGLGVPPPVTGGHGYPVAQPLHQPGPYAAQPGVYPPPPPAGAYPPPQGPAPGHPTPGYPVYSPPQGIGSGGMPAHPPAAAYGPR